MAGNANTQEQTQSNAILRDAKNRKMIVEHCIHNRLWATAAERKGEKEATTAHERNAIKSFFPRVQWNGEIIDKHGKQANVPISNSIRCAQYPHMANTSESNKWQREKCMAKLSNMRTQRSKRMMVNEWNSARSAAMRASVWNWWNVRRKNFVHNERTIRVNLRGVSPRT